MAPTSGRNGEARERQGPAQERGEATPALAATDVEHEEVVAAGEVRLHTGAVSPLVGAALALVLVAHGEDES